jgi:hypothetical protein
VVTIATGEILLSFLGRNRVRSLDQASYGRELLNLIVETGEGKAHLVELPSTNALIEFSSILAARALKLRRAVREWEF